MRNLRFGIIGVGRFGQHYVRLLQEGIEGAVLQKAAYHRTETDSILNDPDIDCVVIATPAATHFDLIKKALYSNKNVLVEKPMVTTLSEAEELAKMVEDSGKVFMVGHQYLYNNHIHYLKSELEKKVLGEISYVFAEHLYPGYIRDDIGIFGDAAPHEFSIIDYLFSPGEIVKASGKINRFKGNKWEDFVAAEFEFENSLALTLILGRGAPEKVRRMLFFSSRGIFSFDDQKEKEKLKFSTPENIAIPTILATEPLHNQLVHFVDCASNGKKPLTDIQHGLRVARMLDFGAKNLV